MPWLLLVTSLLVPLVILCALPLAVFATVCRRRRGAGTWIAYSVGSGLYGVALAAAAMLSHSRRRGHARESDDQLMQAGEALARLGGALAQIRELHQRYVLRIAARNRQVARER